MNDRGRTARVLDDVEYAPGKKFRVIAEGASLSGLEPMSGVGYRGWSRPLQVGEVIVCTGFGPGWGSDPGYGIEWEEEGKSFVEVRPDTGGMWAYRPMPGLLEEVD